MKPSDNLKTEKPAFEFDGLLALGLREWLEGSKWVDRGIVLRELGRLAGLFTSALVHCNWGDYEVAMIFYFLMWQRLRLERSLRDGAVERPILALRV